MFTALSHSAVPAQSERLSTGALLASALVLGCLALSSPAQAGNTAALQKQLTVEQNAVFDLHPPVSSVSTPEPLRVVAWVDHADTTYAIGETVRLFVQSNKDSHVTVMNVGPSGQTTLLFPNAMQPDGKVAANQVVEIAPPGSGASIRVGGPVGRELIKIIASTSAKPVIQPLNMSSSAPFAALESGRSMAKQLQVTMSERPSAEWDDYNKVITTVASRPVTVAPLPASDMSWPTSATGLRIATDKAQYRVGETVTIYAETAKPCYLTLVNAGSSGQTRVLLPNVAQPQNFIPAGHTVVFPGVASGLRITPVGPPGLETVTAICSTDNRPIVSSPLAYDHSGFAMLGMGVSIRDLAMVTTAPMRQLAHTTVGFVVTP